MFFRKKEKELRLLEQSKFDIKRLNIKQGLKLKNILNDKLYIIVNVEECFSYYGGYQIEVDYQDNDNHGCTNWLSVSQIVDRIDAGIFVKQ